MYTHLFGCHDNLNRRIFCDNGTDSSCVIVFNIRFGYIKSIIVIYKVTIHNYQHNYRYNNMNVIMGHKHKSNNVKIKFEGHKRKLNRL